MNRTMVTRLIGSILTIIACISCSSDVHALGVSPAISEFPNILSENSITQTLFISRADVSKDELVSITFQGNGAPYVTVKQSVVLFKEGKRNIPIKLTLAPEGAPIGEYEVKMNLKLEPADSIYEEGVQSVLPSLSARMTFSVTREARASYVMHNTSIPPASVGESSELQYVLHNDGNQSWNPTHTEFTFRHRDTFAETVEIVDIVDISEIGPKAVQYQAIPFQEKLEAGIYQVDVRMLRNEEEIFAKKNIRYVVRQEIIIPKGSTVERDDSISDALSSENTGPQLQFLFGLLSGVILLLGYLLIRYYLLPRIKSHRYE